MVGSALVSQHTSCLQLGFVSVFFFLLRVQITVSWFCAMLATCWEMRHSDEAIYLSQLGNVEVQNP